MYEFLQTLASGLAVVGVSGIVTFLWYTRSDNVRTATKLESHEKICTERYTEISNGFHEVKQMMVEEARLSRENRHNVNTTLQDITNKVAVLQENKRMRERQEDRE